MKTINQEILKDLIILYELSLASAFSNDIEENASFFLRTLMSKKNIHSVIYLKWDGEISLENMVFKYSIPKKNLKQNYQLDLVIKEIFSEKNEVILDKEENQVLNHILEKKATFHLAFLLDNQAILILGRDSYKFTEKEKKQLTKVIQKFGQFMEGLFHREELNAKKEKLEKYIDSNLKLENFAYLASHDLKSPALTINSFASLLVESLSGKISEEELECLNFIHTSSEYMMILIDDLLKFSIINSEPIVLEKINIKELLENLLEEISFDINEYKAKISLQDLPKSFRADKIKIKQVFRNLIINGLKFTCKSKSPNIKVYGEERENDFQFTVEDNGIGVEEEFYKRIFKMFKKMDNSGKNKSGSGLGLSICKKIVNKHGGQIWVESEPEKGSKFIFTVTK